MKKKYTIVILMALISSSQLALSECYSYYSDIPCGPAVGTRFSNCPDAPDMLITAKGSKPVYLYSGTSGGFASLSGTASCSSPCEYIPCDGSPVFYGTYVDTTSSSNVPNSSDSSCGA